MICHTFLRNESCRAAIATCALDTGTFTPLLLRCALPLLLRCALSWYLWKMGILKSMPMSKWKSQWFKTLIFISKGMWRAFPELWSPPSTRWLWIPPFRVFFLIIFGKIELLYPLVLVFFISSSSFFWTKKISQLLRRMKMRRLLDKIKWMWE